MLTTLVLAGVALPLAGQGPDGADGVRFGLTFGGISTIGLAVEFLDDSHSYEVAIGTWSFRDLSLSAVVKEYLGVSALRPFIGAGLWAVAAAPPDERTGLALVLRVPIGLDWRAGHDHFAGAALNINRGLWVRRSDPEDELPMNARLVPLPELYYRFRR